MENDQGRGIITQVITDNNKENGLLNKRVKRGKGINYKEKIIH